MEQWLIICLIFTTILSLILTLYIISLRREVKVYKDKFVDVETKYHIMCKDVLTVFKPNSEALKHL